MRPPISSVGFSRENFFVFDSSPRGGEGGGCYVLRVEITVPSRFDVGNFVWIKLNISRECSSYDRIVTDFFSRWYFKILIHLLKINKDAVICGVLILDDR